MEMHCDKCKKTPTTNEDYFYDLRATVTGKDSLTEGFFTDLNLCRTCMLEWIKLNGFDTVKFVRRIENPMYGRDPIW